MMATKNQEKIWQFDVCEPTLHPNGFTIYKVSCKVFIINSPESLTEVIIWKRYNDFKNLYKSILSLHRSLHRKEEFPPFAKPKLFGRFEDAVIEERRISAVNLLTFIGTQHHLYRSKVFKEFVKGGKIRQGLSGDMLKPSKLDIFTAEVPSLPTDDKQEVCKPLDHSLKKPHQHPPTDTHQLPPTEKPECAEEEAKETSNESADLDGVWNFPQIPDNISLNSFDDDTDEIDVDSTLSNSLPDTDLSYFDPLKHDGEAPSTEIHTSSTEIHTSSSWLFDAMNTCADMEAKAEIEDQETCKKAVLSPDNGIQMNFNEDDKATEEDKTKGNNSILNSSTTDLSDFDPLKQMSDNKVEYGKGDLDTSFSSSGGSAAQGTSRSSSAAPSPRHHQSNKSQRKLRSHTGESVSTMDLGGKEDYIYMAANQICLAQEHEANSRFELAFSCYKTGVGILLQGVQGDNNKARRDAVRRKTAQYLIKAEDLYKRHLAKETVDEKRWAESELSPMTEMDPALTLIKGPVSELKNYKVLGTVDKVLLVMDKTTDETFVIKTIRKSSICSGKLLTILLTSCPFMVGLHKFYETENAVHLLLQYATGGKLWLYIGAYLQANRSQQRDELGGQVGDEEKNIYSGQKIHTDDNCSENINLSQKSKKVNEDKHSTSLVVSSDHTADRSSETVVSHESKDGDMCVSVGFSKDKSEEVSLKLDQQDHCLGNKNILDDNDDVLNSDQHMSLHRRVTAKRSMSTNSDMSEPEQTEFSAVPFEQRSDTRFKDVLQSSKSNLEFFSINSFDSNDGIMRIDSNISSDAIDIIMEENEDSPRHRLCNKDEGNEVFIGQNIVKDSNGCHSDKTKYNQQTTASDSEVIVQNARDLIKSVSRTLSQTDAEVEKMISPQKLSDLNDLSSNDCDKNVSMQLSSKDFDHATKGQFLPIIDKCLDDPDSDSANETSIYDLNRSNECSSESDTEISKTKKDSEFLDADSVLLLSRERDNTLTKHHADSDVDSDKTLSGEKVSSRSSTFTEKSVVPPKRLSLTRMNSKELRRSASLERELTSPYRSRLRSVSHVFEQLDAATSNFEHVLLPESSIRHWAAEIIVALSRLHDENIVCRDLKPDNILLGDRGHVLLTYFCQLRVADQEIDFDAIQQLYVAPEVRSIASHTNCCDWWSVGALLYELLTGVSLASCHPGGINSHTQLFIPGHISSEAKSLLKQLLCYNPRERLGAGINGVEEIKSHPFFTSIDWNALEQL